MTTYQDIVDYMNNNYNGGKFTLVKHDPGYIIVNNNGIVIISINEDYYSTIGSFNVEKGLSKLLTDLLDTPVNKRNKPEIKNTIKPVTKESVDTANLLTRLTSADQVIQAINTFLVSARCNYAPIITIATDIGRDNLNKVLKLYDDYNIRITTQIPPLNPVTFNLLIEPK